MNRAQRLDEDAPLIDQRLAVWVAGVIDEARLVSVRSRIDDGLSIDDEQKRMCVIRTFVLIAAVRLPMRDAFAEILNDARAFADAPAGEHPAAVHPREAYREHARLARDQR